MRFPVEYQTQIGLLCENMRFDLMEKLRKISLAPDPGIRTWLERFAAVPGYVKITWTP